MKKIVILVLFFMILACLSESDENQIPEVNLLIGTWKPIKRVDVCSIDNQHVYDYTDCQQMGRIIFSTDGTLNISENEGDIENCEVYYRASGTWIIEEGVLTAIIGSQTVMPTFIEFSSNTLRLGNYITLTNDTCDNGELLSHFYTEFERI